MARVTGIGGVFFKAEDPEALTAWYRKHLGLPVDDDGVVVIRWGGETTGSTVWAPFESDTAAFEWPAEKQWLVNYRVDDLDGMLEQLRDAGVQVDDETWGDMNGIFGHSWDPEGNRIQLWQPRPGM